MLSNVKRTKKIINCEDVYLISLLIFIYTGVLKNSLLVPVHISMQTIFFVFKVTSVIAIFAFFLRPVRNWYSKLPYILVMVVGYWLCIPSTNFDFFYYLLFVIGAYQIRFNQILKVYLTAVLGGTITVVLLCFIGVIPNDIFSRQGLSMVRNSFGFFTPTDFAARIFFIMLAYYMINHFHLSWKSHLMLFIIICLVYYLTNARLDTLLLLLLLCCGIFSVQLQKIVRFCGSLGSFLLVFMYMLLNVLMSACYTSSVKILQSLNNLLSDRIALGQQAIQEKGIKLFGQHFQEQGNGRMPQENFHYFYIDSSYIRLLVISGVMITLILLFAIYFLQRRFIDRNLYYYSLGLFLVLISSAIDQHFLDPSYNMLFLGLLADVGKIN